MALTLFQDFNLAAGKARPAALKLPLARRRRRRRILHIAEERSMRRHVRTYDVRTEREGEGIRKTNVICVSVKLSEREVRG